MPKPYSTEKMKLYMRERRLKLNPLPVVVPIPTNPIEPKKIITKIIVKNISIIDREERFYLLNHNKKLQSILPFAMERAEFFNWFYYNSLVQDEYRILSRNCKKNKYYKKQHKIKFINVLDELRQ